ncbi:MAG: hypothetical protein L0G85_08860 [Kocuria sp.]|nr:hypothetical protein [Kocuria sp.]
MDSRYPCHYLTDRRVQRLSDGAHRTLVTATAWCVDNRTDGDVPAEDLDLIPRAKAEHMAELVKRDLAIVTDDGWLLTEYGKSQSSAAQIDAALEARRASDRERQAKARAKKKPRTDAKAPTEEQVSRDCHVTFGGEERRGEERRGEASFDEEDSSSASNDPEDFTSWPVAAIPSDDPGPRSSVTGESWPDPLVRDAAEPARSYCRVGGCANRPLPGMAECVEHAAGREQFEESRARQLAELEQMTTGGQAA